MMSQAEFNGIFTSRPQNFAWFLGAGTSRSAGLPTATDIIWDLKRRHYRREENQDISRQDMQTDAVKARIQAFMDARGFPALWADDEYTSYFEKIFGDDKEQQRRYMQAMLSEDKVSLSVGNRVLGALMASGMCRAVFTTNFDSIVEKAVAEVAGQSLSAFHIEGSGAANNALNNEEFPIYCKLHGDFRYESIKNLRVCPESLRTFTEPSDHEPDGGELEEGEGTGVEALPVLGEASASSEPSKRSFHHPPPGKNDEALGLIGAFDDLHVHRGDGLFQARLEFLALVSAIGKKLQEERKESEQGCHDHHAAVTVLDVGGVDEGMHQQALGIDENVPFLALDLLSRIVAMRVDAAPPFSAPFTLWLSITAAVGEASRSACSRHWT